MEEKTRSDPGVRSNAEPPKAPQLRNSQTLLKFREKFRKSFIEDSYLTVLEQIGEGGFAVVYKCKLSTRDGGGEVVAVKELRDSCFASERDVDDFFSETQLLRILNHPNIVDFKGVASQVGDGEPCLAVIQEFMNLGSLKDLLVKQMRSEEYEIYSWEEGLTWMLQVARGLAYLHGLKATVIHRDLKPENILLTCLNGSQVYAKIADFGLSAMVKKPKTPFVGLGKASLDVSIQQRNISKTVHSRSFVTQASGSLRSASNPRKLGASDRLRGSNLIRNSTLLERLFPDGNVTSVTTGSWDDPEADLRRFSSKEEHLPPIPREDRLHNLSGRTGSLMYMAPEVLRSEKYNEKVDTFSFGVVLFEVLSGYKIIYMILDMDKDPMPQVESYAENIAKGFRPPIPKEWPQNMAKLIQDCWAADPKDRPRMTEVVKRLEAILLEERSTLGSLLKGCFLCCPVQ